MEIHKKRQLYTKNTEILFMKHTKEILKNI
jgi:hypothetical protein